MFNSSQIQKKLKFSLIQISFDNFIMNHYYSQKVACLNHEIDFAPNRLIVGKRTEAFIKRLLLKYLFFFIFFYKLLYRL